jgi:uncharacterized membrane protein YccC
MAEGEATERRVTPTSGHRSLPERWEVRDPGLRATKRSVRAAVLVPAVFALAEFGVGNAQTTLFGVFGSFALLLFADFGGPTRVRLRSYFGLFVTGAVLIIAGTLCSTHAATAVIGMAVFGFAVLFAGAVSPQAAVGATAALLTFVLPVAVSGGSSAIGSRLAGWGLAGAFCIPAVMLVRSGRWHDPLRRSLAAAARGVAELVDAHADGRRDPAAWKRAEEALHRLRAQYEATPYRPAGAGPTDTALVSLVSRMEWVGESALVPYEARTTLAEDRSSQPVHAAVARVLRQIADLVERDDALLATCEVDVLAEGADALAAACEVSRGGDWQHLLADADGSPRGMPDLGAGQPGSHPLWALDPSYPIRILAIATGLTAEVALGTVRAPRGPGRLDRARESLLATVRAARARLTFRSVWFRNSLRGAAALSLAVFVVELTDVQHGFWVVLGTLSVLRSNALGTGANALRAVIGTVIGFAVGSLVLLALGPHLDLLWAVLPVAVLLAGVAPSAISFAAGQAGFTVAVVIIFNILDPVGVKVGLVRVEDVAIGVGVSVVVGLLFWPRGAATELARTLGEAYAAAAGWLVVEIERAGVPHSEVAVSGPRTAAMDAAHRLDDAFRQFMSERGDKPVALTTVTHLVTGSAQVQLVALTLATFPDLPTGAPAIPLATVSSARRDVTSAFSSAGRWFEAFADALGRRHVELPAIGPIDSRLRPELLAAFDDARQAQRKDEMLAALRLVWLSERLEDLRLLQTQLATSAGRFVGPRQAENGPM